MSTAADRESLVPSKLVWIATLTVALAPDAVVLTTVANSPLTPRRIALLILGGVALVALLLRPTRLRTLSARWLWTALGVSVTIGALLNSRPQGIILWSAYVLGPALVGAGLARDGDQRRIVHQAMAVGGVLLSIIAILEFIRGETFFAPVDAVDQYTRSGGIRAFAGWQHPLALGMYLSMSVFLCGTLSRSVLVRLGAVLLHLLGILVTQQRSPLIGVLAGLVVLFVFQPGVKRRIGTAFVGVTITGGLLLSAHPSVVAYRNYLLDSFAEGSEASGTVRYRSILLEVGSDRIMDDPIFGHGFGSVTNGMSEILTYGSLWLTDVANTPLALALETGLIGLGLWISILGVAIHRLWRSRGEDRLAGYPAAAITAAVITSIGVMTTPSLALLMFLVGSIHDRERNDLKRSSFEPVKPPVDAWGHL